MRRFGDSSQKSRGQSRPDPQPGGTPATPDNLLSATPPRRNPVFSCKLTFEYPPQEPCVDITKSFTKPQRLVQMAGGDACPHLTPAVAAQALIAVAQLTLPVIAPALDGAALLHPHLTSRHTTPPSIVPAMSGSFPHPSFRARPFFITQTSPPTPSHCSKRLHTTPLELLHAKHSLSMSVKRSAAAETMHHYLKRAVRDTRSYPAECCTRYQENANMDVPSGDGYGDPVEIHCREILLPNYQHPTLAFPAVLTPHTHCLHAQNSSTTKAVVTEVGCLPPSHSRRCRAGGSPPAQAAQTRWRPST